MILGALASLVILKKFDFLIFYWGKNDRKSNDTDFYK